MYSLQRCGQKCNILILLKQGHAKGYLFHNKNNRYSENSVPLAEKVNVYNNIENLKIPQRTIKIAVPVLFSGKIPKQPALT